MLFRGHPELIGGFNVFLPTGFRIDVSSDPQDSVIIITTPLGIINQPTDGSKGMLIPNSIQPPPSSNSSTTTPNFELAAESLLRALTADWKNIDVGELEILLNTKEGRETAVELRGQNAAGVIDILDQVPRTPCLFLHTNSHVCRP